MYPWFRFIKSILSAGRQKPLEWHEAHVSKHICWPWDLDPWNELNNGRALTLFDLGRVGWSARMNVGGIMRKKRWGFAIAGTSVRYRRRIQMFHKLEMRTRIVCWDDRFFYYEQTFWKSDGECAVHAVIRAAITSRNGIVPPKDMIEAMDRGIETPEIPAWIQKWSDSEADRPWPPMLDTF